MDNKKLVLCAALYVFAAVDYWVHRNSGPLDGATVSSSLFSFFGIARCALMALALWLAVSAESTPRTSQNKGPARFVFFSGVICLIFYSWFFILPIVVLFLLKLFAYALTVLFLLWVKTQ